MLEHDNLGRLQKNKSLQESHINVSKSEDSDSSFLEQSRIHKDRQQDNNQQMQEPASLEKIETEIHNVLDDHKKMARFGKVIAAASLYEQAATEKDKINCLTAIRDSAANYLIERKQSSDPERKVLCERLILYIDSYAAANNIEIAHSTTYMLDGRYMTYDEIDNEIRLAHSLTGAEPLSEVSKERRDAFKKKLEDVKTAGSYKADIEKWKNEKRELLRQKKEELGIGEGVNEGYDSICADTVLWYGRVYNRKDEAMTTMLSRLTIDDNRESLPISIKARQIEVILADILSWNMDDFTFARSEDFLHRKDRGETSKEHFLRLYSKLQLAKNANLLLGELLRMRDNENYNSPCDFSEKTLEELKDRLKIYKEIEKDYSERLSIMSSPYYALLQRSDTESAMAGKSDDKLLSLKQEKDIPGTRFKKKVPAEFAEYIDKLHAKKKRWDKTKIGDYFSRKTRIENALDRMLDHKGMTIRERENRILTERNALERVFAQNLTEFKQEQVMASKPELKKAIENESPEIERQNIDSSMRAIQGRSFIPVERPASRMGLWGTLKTYGLAGARWMIGATVGKIGTVFGFLAGARKQLQEKNRVDSAQKKRIHGIVPGTKDEHFADEHITDNDDEQNILYDFRRAPLVWEKLSAGDPEDPPEVTIMASQSIQGSRAVDPTYDMGHAMIGLSYSRFNKATGRKERYNLRIGFYPGAGANKLANHAMMGANALMHGRIQDDSNHSYNIARKYTVTPGAINRILRASEKYADGGYGYYTRNCTTFVTDMAKLADIPLADSGVNDLLDVNGFLPNAGGLLVGAANTAYYIAANNIADKFQAKDQSYQNFGQKLTTKEDLDRYYDTAKNAGQLKKAASPGAMGEDLREAKSGDLTALDTKEVKTEFDTENDRDVFILDIQDKLTEAGRGLVDQIKNRLREQELLTDEISQSLETIKENINLSNVLYQEGEHIAEAVKDRHKKIRDNMKLVNSFYANTLKNDSLLNEAVMNYLGLCEASLNMLDITYQNNIKYEYKGDVGGLFDDYTTDRNIMYRDANRNSIEITMSPIEYYGWLKTGKSGPQIVKDFEEFYQLRNIPYNDRTEEQQRRLDTLGRQRETALSFGYANYFNLYKDEFSQKDIEYAFKNLPIQEKATKPGETLGSEFFSFYTPSCIYQAVILGKVFDGIGSIQFTDLSSNDAVFADLDKHFETKMLANKDTMKTILASFISGKESHASEALAMEFINLPIGALVNSALRNVAIDEKNKQLIPMSLLLMEKTNRLIANMIKELREEGQT